MLVCAAGNSAINNEATPFYPASYTQDNIISVASTDNNDALSSFSNYGATRVDLATSGNGILEGSVDTTVTATYLDADDNLDRSTAQARLVGQTSTPVVRFTDRAGTDVTEYNIGSPDGVFVTVSDPAANKTASASVRDTVVTSVFDTTTKAGTDPVRTQGGKLSVASEAPPA